MNTQSKQLYRSRTNRMIGGVCAGLGEFFALDPTLIRLLFVLGTIFGFGSFIIIYLVMLVVVPEEPGAPIVTTPAAVPTPTVPPTPADTDNPNPPAI